MGARVGGGGGRWKMRNNNLEKCEGRDEGLCDDDVGIMEKGLVGKDKGGNGKG